MGITYIPASIGFTEQALPSLSKSEFGIDTLTRKFKGPATKLVSYLAGLRQGSQPSGYSGFYLQTWSVDDNAIFPCVTLLYKGLIGAIPNPIISDSITIQTVTISTASPSQASREIQFYANETKYKYITNARPAGYKYKDVSIGTDPIVINSNIKTADGKAYFGAAPAALVTALTPAIVSMNTSHSAEPVYGTPFFECEDVAIRTYFGG
jgi:hypothetical protein